MMKSRLRFASFVCLCLAALGGLLWAAGCPDPCVWADNGCNQDSDCAPMHVCLQRPDLPGQCSLVKGTCELKGSCYSASDCADGQCCDEQLHVCAPAGACTPSCNRDEDCDGRWRCSETHRCRPPCVDDGDCGSDSICKSNYCVLPVGAPCPAVDTQMTTYCGFLRHCIDDTVDGKGRLHPYCTLRCSLLPDGLCPAGFSCDALTETCLANTQEQ